MRTSVHRSPSGRILSLALTAALLLQWMGPSLVLASPAARDIRTSSDHSVIPPVRYFAGMAFGSLSRPSPLTLRAVSLPDPGGVLTVTLAVTNPTGEPVLLTEATPPDTVFDHAEVLDDGGATWFMGGLLPGQRGTFTWFTGDRVGLGRGLAPGRTARLALVVRPGAGAVPPLPLRSLASSSLGGTLQAESTTLSIIKSDSPDPVDQGALLTYVITVTNQTAEAASQVVVTDTTPAGTVFASANVLAGGGATWFHGGLSPGQTGPYIWFTGDRVGMGGGLPGNTSAVLQFIVRPLGPFPDEGVVHNDDYHASALNAPLASGADVTTTINAPVFALGKIASSDPITAGARLTYTLFLTNTGHLTTSLPYTIVETLPAYTTYAGSVPAAQVAGNTLTWTLTAPLPPGQAAQVTFAVTVTAPLTDGTPLVNADYRAFSGEVATSAQGTPVTVTVRSWPTLSIAKTDTPDPVPAGDLVTYTLTVTNTAGAIGPALNTVVTDVLPAYVQFQNCSGCTHASGTVTWALGTLGVGESRTLTLVGRVYSPLTDTLTLTNTAEVGAANALVPVGVSETTTVSSAPAFTVTKSVYPGAVVAGTVVTYTIVVTNTGNETAASAMITDTLPGTFTFGGMVQGPAPSQSGSDLIWSGLVITGTIWPSGWISPPGPVTLVFTATAVGNDTYFNAVTVTQGAVWAATGPTAPVQVGAPELSITKSGSHDPATPGQPLAYTIVYSNTRSVPASGVVVTDTLPAFITGGYASPPPSSGTIAAGATITWTIGPLAGNTAGQIALVVTLTVPIADGTVLTNTAGIACAEGVSDQTFATTTVRSAPAFQVTKTASHNPVRPGDRVTFTVAVTNTGTENATGVVITDALPAHTTFASATPPYSGPSGGILTWTVGTLNVNASAVYTLAVTVNSPLTNGLQLVNAAFVSSDQGVTAGASATVTVQSAPVLALAKADSPDPVQALGTLVYTLVFTNTGDEVATGVWLTDTLPAGVTLVAASPPTTTQAGNVVGWYLNTLATDGPHTAILTVTVSLLPDGTVLTNQALLDSDQTEPVTDTETTTVRVADLVVDKWTVGPPVIGPGDRVTFTLRVTNTGSLTASGTRITDTLPTGFTAVYSEAVGATWDSGTVWTANLAQGAWAAITLTAQAPFTPWGPVTRTVVNTATAATAVTEADLSDNQDTSTVAVIPGPAGIVTLTAVPDTLPVGSPAALTARVEDAWGNPVLDGTSVTFATTLGNLNPPSGWTTANGQATANLNSTLPGVALVTATVGALSDTTLVTFTAGAVHHFAFSTIGDQVAGVDFTVAITAYDAFDNVATWFNGTVTLSDPATGSLQPTTSDPFVDGVLASQTVSITVARANQPIRAISGTIQSDSNPFTVTHNLAVTMTLAPQNATVAAGNTLTYTAIATDTYGNGWTATSEVTFTTSGGNTFLGTPPGNNVFSATVAGVNFPITGTIAGATGPVVATTAVTVTPGPAVSLTIAPRGAVVTAGDQVTYTAVATDAFGNSWDATGETTWAAGGGNAFATNVLSATVAGTWPVTGAISSVADTTAITITPGPMARLAMASVGDPQTAGVPFGLVITATDGFGNVATNFSDSLNLTDTTGTLTPLTWSAWVNGVATPTVTIIRAWVNDRITATLTATPTIFVASNPFTVVANVPATVVYTTPASLRVCESVPVTATVTDAWNNPVRDGTVVTLTSDGVRLWFRESGNYAYYPTTVGGMVTATLVGGTAASPPNGWTLAEAGTVNSGIKWVTIITPGLPATVNLVAAPTTLPIGGHTGLLTATVRDCAANPVADGTPVDWMIVPPLATIGPDPASTTGGVATAVFTSGMTVGTAVVTAVVDSLVATTTLTFISGPPHTLTLAVHPTTLVADGTSTAAITATVKDQYNNPVANGTPVTFTLTPALGTVAPNPASTVGGVATATFTAGTTVGTAVLTATVDGLVATATLTLTVGPPYTLTLAVHPTTLLADGSSTAAITATVTDRYSNPVADGTRVTLTLSAPLGGVAPSVATTTNGIATATFTAGTTVGTAVLTATTDGRVATATLTLISGPPHTLTLAVHPTTLVANGTSTAAITATVRDQYNNPVANGTRVTFTLAPALGTVAPNPASTVGGVATATFTAGTVTGTVVITAMADSRIATATVTLVLTPTYYVYLPLVMRNHGAAADLVVDSIVVNPPNPTTNTPVVVSVTIRNAGGTTVSQPFWVDLYLDPRAVPQPGDLWNHLCTYGKAWYVRTPIPAGGTLTLNTTMPDDPTSPGDRYSNWPTGGLYLSAGPHTLWAQVDSYPATPGAVLEGNETNNISGPLAFNVSLAQARSGEMRLLSERSWSTLGAR